MDDIQIVNRVINGEVELFSAIVERYHLKVYSLCIGFIHQQEDAEDITQDIFTNVFTSLDSFKGNSQFSTWLYRIAVNTTYTFLRQKRRREAIMLYGMFFTAEFEFSYTLPHCDEPDRILSKKQTNEKVFNAIDSLPSNQRKAFILSKYDDLSQRKIAEIMKISEEAVESLLQRAKRNLQTKLRKFYNTEFQPTDFSLASD
jgi:RNA polymerase sigma factor (sigma-70 family)